MIAEAQQTLTGLGGVNHGQLAIKAKDGPRTSALNKAVLACQSVGIKVLSLRPEWIELRVPCAKSAIDPLHQLLTHLDADLTLEKAEAISYAFREMFRNALEYGGQFNPRKQIEVRFIRTKRAVICRIKDPGNGFDPRQLSHAAINNPNSDPIRHASVREKNGLRAGGFGILLTTQLVDELVYNETHNEVLFIKYLF